MSAAFRAFVNSETGPRTVHFWVSNPFFFDYPDKGQIRLELQQKAISVGFPLEYPSSCLLRV